MRRLPVDLRGVRQEDRELVVRNPFGGLLDVVHAIEVGVVDASEVKSGAPALDRLPLVEQHPDAHLFQCRHHANRVVIAEHAVDRSFEFLAKARDAGERIGVRPERLRPIIAGKHADIVIGAARELGHARHCRFAQLHMKVADVQDGEAVKSRGQVFGDDAVVPQFDLR